MHASHAVLPEDETKVPGGQLVHAAMPGAPLLAPGEQGTGATLPVAQLEPGGHSTHCSGAARSVALEKRPFGHGSGDAVPILQ